VFELLGPTVARILGEYNEADETIEPRIILRISEQLLEAIKFIHDAGMGHGDISGNNAAFTCGHLSSATKEDLFEVLGTPISAEVARLDGKPLGETLPKHLVMTAEWDTWTDEDVECLRIIDLGESFLQGMEPTKLAQPGPLQAPETIFTEHFDHRVDLWRAGCVVSCSTHFAER
jgi:serine/threonine protein kinase